MRLLGMISLMAVAATMAGCASTGGVKQPTAPETVPSEKALALPPPGGPSIVGVIERKRGNGTEQTISLFTSSSVPGQNVLKIQFLGASGANPGTSSVSYKMINEGEMAREMFRAVPGVTLVRSGAFLQNSYGPFGYASGRSRSGDTCIYAWQQIRSSHSAQTQARNFGMIQVRLRLCDANATERQLLGIVYGYTITGTLDGEIWNPYGDAPGADAALGRTGSPIYPDEGGYRNNPMSIGYDAAPVAIRRVAVAPVRSVAAERPDDQEATQQQKPLGPRVPLPDLPAETPQASVAAAPQPAQQSAKATGVTVPSPDCIGDAVMTTACRR